MKKLQLLAVCLLLHSCVLFAQGNVGIGTTAPHTDALLHIETGNDPTKGLLVTGHYQVGSTVPNLSPGSRLMFFPGKAAFRAGAVNANQWDNEKVGQFSSALGFNGIASGSSSTALGSNNTASGPYALAVGFETTASGTISISTGESTKSEGRASLATGWNTQARGFYSASFGQFTRADGWGSVAFGDHTITRGGYVAAFGIYNDSLDDGTTLPGAKPLFMVGNGTGDNQRSNAVVIRYNGNVGVGTDAMFARLSIAHNSELTSPTLSLYEAENDFARLQFHNQGTGKFWHAAAYSNAANDAASRFNVFYDNGTTGTDILSIGGDGNATLSGVLAQNSDARLKKNISPLSNALHLLLLSGYHYCWKGPGRDTSLQTGVLAQEVQKVFPELVKQDKTGALSVNYSGFVPYLIEAAKEQQKEIESLKTKNKLLEVRLEKLEKLLEKK